MKNEKLSIIYLKAVSFLLPPLFVLSIAMIFVVPKIKQMCADVGYDPRGFFGPLDFVRDQWWMLVAAIFGIVVVLEVWAPFWRKHRSGFVGALVFVLNSAILIELLCTLLVAAIVGPAMRGK